MNESTVYGGQGDDKITAKNAFDQISGNLGNDSFNITGATVVTGSGGVGANTSAHALTITDFVTGEDTITLGGGGAGTTNFATRSVNGGLDQAIKVASTGAGQYTFVAGSTDGYLFLASSTGTLTGAVLTGDNSTALFSSKDIAG